MKRAIVLVIVLVVAGLIVFTLFKNKAEVSQKIQRGGARIVAVSVAPTVRQTVHQTLTQEGTVDAINNVAVVSDMQMQGRVTAVMVKEGSYVSAGSPILKVEDQVPEANYLTAQTNYQKAQKDLERSETLNKQGLISETQVESARQTLQAAEAQYIAAQRQYHHSVITAPISGIVSSLPVNIGAMVNSGTTVANVVDISRLKVRLNVGEKDVFKLKTGDAAEVVTDIYPGVKYTGKINYVGVQSDGAHTYPVELTLPNQQQHPLKSGMFCKVTFDFGSQEALTIPRDAILGSIENPQVFVVENNKAKSRNIQVSSQVDTNVIVLQGLQEGEKVVISGQFNLKDNSDVMVGGVGQNPGMRGGWQGKRQGGLQGQPNGNKSGSQKRRKQNQNQ